MESELYDIEQLWHIPFWQTKQFYWALIGLCIVFISLLILVIIKKLFFKKRIKTPWEIAFAQLATLKKNNLISAEHGKEFYCALTSIIKEYLQNRYQIDVVSATDTELIAILERQSEFHIPLALSAQVREVIDGMAFIKYAKIEAAQKKIDADFERVMRIVKETIPHQSQLKV